MGTLDERYLKGNNNESAGAGTTKRKELHGTVNVRALSGMWRESPNGAAFHAYKIDFFCDSEMYPSFVLLTELRLEQDAANANVDLFLIDKTVKSSVVPSGEVHMDVDQIKRAKLFHELIFNGLFGKLFLGSKESGTPREFLLQKDLDFLWSPGYMYLILPLESLDTVDSHSWRIDWKAVDSCVTVVEFMKSSAWLSAELSKREDDCSNASLSAVDANCGNENAIHLANCSLCVENLKDTVVMSIHTGRIYYVAEVLANTSAESPFDADTRGAPPKYSSFADYFNKKYEMVMLYPKQPMLRLKNTHNPFNLLSDSEAGALRRKLLSSGDIVNGKRFNHIHMPPELVVRINIPVQQLRAFYLIPSVMHRLESLLLAGQLRDEVALNLDKFQVPCSLILEALTTQRCLEEFSSERLELLGDSVLKYVVSCHLFLKYPQKHEGKLSSHRQGVICNAALYDLGISRRLHEYIRDSPFEPRRWVAPGQLTALPLPCSHGIDTSEVPLDGKYQTIDEKVMLAKSCDRGHRWLVSKSIADCVEALIGAYYVGGGLTAAVHVMKWLGIEVELEPYYVDRIISTASDRSCTQNADQIASLESKLGYEFSTKGLLLEAITHVTDEFGTVYCYERLEFLGDAVLDVLMTWYLYQNHADIDPGELTDLRSASVNNENFAQVAVRKNLYLHLQHSSELLYEQITEYVKLVTEIEDGRTLQGRQCPKALGDLVESIAGAVLIDSKLNVEEVWRIFEPLLSPIVTPDNLELAPYRELIELCGSLGYFIKEDCVNEKDVVFAEIRLRLKDVLLIGEGIGKTKKAAKGEAALHLLKDLEIRGISYAHCVLKREKRESDDVSSVLDVKFSLKGGTNTLKTVSNKKRKVAVGNSVGPDGSIPMIAAINTQKGGPRCSLFELCKRLQWPLPNFETSEHKSRSPIEFAEGSNIKQSFNSFLSKISLCIPDFGVVEMAGEQRADKKSSQDSAALGLLFELQRQGKIVIGCS